MKNLTIMVGAPGSGKSTYAKELVRANKDFVIVSSDEIREKLFGDAAKQNNPAKVFAEAYARTNKTLADGKDVIFDSTALNPYHRSLIIKECGKNAKQIKFVFVDTPLAVCLERNRSRARHVPDDVIRRYIARLIPPTEAEGGKVVYVGGNAHA